MSGRPNNKGRNGDGHFTMMIRSTMEKASWQALSTTAQALYPWLKLEWHGPKYNNNGKIRLSVRQAGELLGVVADTAARAFHDLQAKGFIVQTEAACLGVAGEAKSPAYELTELALPKEREGRKLYLQWQPGSDFPVHRAAPNNPKGVNRKIKTPSRKLGRSCPKNHDVLGDSPGRSVLEIGTSLSARDGEVLKTWRKDPPDSGRAELARPRGGDDA